ncbi:hypothetical protein J6590_037350 [Homalodisca vitripennis]|nr:hypothetical protein J6590_037350 [Homalodisca vitripennis]
MFMCSPEDYRNEDSLNGLVIQLPSAGRSASRRVVARDRDRQRDESRFTLVSVPVPGSQQGTVLDAKIREVKVRPQKEVVDAKNQFPATRLVLITFVTVPVHERPRGTVLEVKAPEVKVILQRAEMLV